MNSSEKRNDGFLIIRYSRSLRVFEFFFGWMNCTYIYTYLFLVRWSCVQYAIQSQAIAISFHYKFINLKSCHFSAGVFFTHQNSRRTIVFLSRSEHCEIHWVNNQKLVLYTRISSVIEMYNPYTHRWQRETDRSYSRKFHSYTSSNTQIFAFVKFSIINMAMFEIFVRSCEFDTILSFEFQLVAVEIYYNAFWLLLAMVAMRL